MAKKKEAKPKKSNIYKATTIVSFNDGKSEDITRVDMVRAKTSAGAAKFARDNAVNVRCEAVMASQDDLLAFAGKGEVLGEKAAG